MTKFIAAGGYSKPSKEISRRSAAEDGKNDLDAIFKSTDQKQESPLNSLSSSDLGIDQHVEAIEHVCVKIATKSEGGVSHTFKLSVPRTIHDNMTTEDHEIINEVIRRMFESVAYRQTLKHTIKFGATLVKPLPLSPPPHFPNVTRLSGFLGLSMSSEQWRQAPSFRLMDLPPEIRVMIAKFAVYVPQGLTWIWKKYRRSRRVATLRTRCFRNIEVSELNAIARTCQTIHQETRGLVLDLNVVHFDPYEMFRGTRKQWDSSLGQDTSLRASLEALDYLLSRTLRCSLLDVKHVVLYCLNSAKLESHLHDVNNFGKLFRIVVVAGSWNWYSLEKLSYEDSDSESEDDSRATRAKDRYQNEMRKRVDGFISEGKKVIQATDKLSVTDRHLQVFPNPKAQDEFELFKEVLSAEEEVLVQDWLLNGV